MNQWIFEGCVEHYMVAANSSRLTKTAFANQHLVSSNSSIQECS